MQAHDLARMHVGGDRHLARRRVGADQPPDEEVALQVLGLVGVDDDPHQQTALDEPQVLGGQRLDRLAQLLERGPAGQLGDDVAVRRGDGQLRPERRGALRDARQHFDAVQAHAHRALEDDVGAPEEHSAAVQRTPRGEPAEQRHHRRAVGEEPQDRVGREARGVREQDRGRRTAQIGHPGQRSGVLLELLHRRAERGGGALAEMGGPDRHRRAALDFALGADDAARATPDQLVGCEGLVDSLQSGLRRGQVRTGREHDRQVAVGAAQGGTGRGARLDRSLARAGKRGQAGADTDGHRTTTILRAVPTTTVVAIFGPTGVGKTAVAVALAERLRDGGEDPAAVSADALQLYRGLETLTGAPSAEQRARLEHRLLGVLPVTGTPAPARSRAAHTTRSTRCSPPAAGRSWSAAPGSTCARPSPSWTSARPSRPRSEHAVARSSPPRGRRRCTPSSRGGHRRPRRPVKPSDAQRVTRALELLDAGHPPPPAAERSRLWTAELRRPTLLAGLTMDREALQARIEARVDAMVAAGAAREVEAAVAAGASAGARQALGFDALLHGDVTAMKAQTRRYAKRQLTWMRKLPGVTPIDVTAREPDEVAGELHELLRERESA
jgi:tRNA dimethylallyltransferase